MGLQLLLEENRDEVLRRFVARLRLGNFDTDDQSRIALLDGLPSFLDRLTLELATAARPEDPIPIGAPGDAGIEHGQQRFDIGFDVLEVAREWAVLRDVVIELMIEQRVEFDMAEYRAMSRHLSAAALSSLEQFVVSSEQARLRLAAEHTGFLVHDLRNQLTGATAALSWWRHNPEVAKLAAATIEASLNALTHVLDQELTVARLDAVRGGIELKREAIEMVELAAALESEVFAVAAMREVTVRIDVDDGLVISGDRRVLRSAIGNILGNAVKFTRPGTTVTLRARAIGERVAIEISDSCGGLKEGLAARLFEPHAAAGSSGGYGLGTAIARQAVEAHGGVIAVEDRPGHGCQFRILLRES